MNLGAVWNAFLPIAASLRGDDPPVIDRAWLMAQGIEGDAPAVLRTLRQRVLPLLRDLERKAVLRSYSFLVHDRTSGVPCPPEDPSPYIHLRLVLNPVADARKLLPKEWVFVRRVKADKDEERAHNLIDRQAALYREIVEAAPGDNEVDVLRYVGQHLHFFANMSQMRVA